jgi:thymidylate synthase ThyX
MITATIIKDSVNISDKVKPRLTTFELDYPRYIHGEIMTHRMLSRNAQSSRAVPVANTLRINEQYVTPLVWGKNKAGMSSEETLEGIELESAKQLWDAAAKHAFAYSEQLSKVGLHKQWTNRITEPFSMIKTIISATEFDNMLWLRDDPDAAQPEIVELARKMKTALDNSTPEQLVHGQWHLPYIKVQRDTESEKYFDSNGEEITLEEARMISASCCAQVSYRKLNETKEKAIDIYNRLFSGPKPHLSPVEHVAMAFEDVEWWEDMPKGVTHCDREGNLWSANFKGFIQYRQLLEQAD